MKHNYTTPTLLEEKIEFERGYNLSPDIDDWYDNDEDLGGSAD